MRDEKDHRLNACLAKVCENSEARRNSAQSQDSSKVSETGAQKMGKPWQGLKPEKQNGQTISLLELIKSFVLYPDCNEKTSK